MKNRILKGHIRWVRCVSFSPDGNLVASVSTDGTLRIWNAHTGKQLNKITEECYWLDCVAISPDGKTVATGSTFLSVRDVETGIKLRHFSHHANVESIAFSPCDPVVATCCQDGCMRVWHLKARKLLGNTLPTIGGMHHVAFSPDGKTIATTDSSVSLWDANNCELIKTFDGHTDRVWCVDFSPDGTQIVSGSEDGTIRMWDVESTRMLLLVNNDCAVYSVAFSHDGKYCVSGLKNAFLRIFDSKTGRTLRHNYSNFYTSKLACSPKGKKIAYALRDNRICVENMINYAAMLNIAQNFITYFPAYVLLRIVHFFFAMEHKTDFEMEESHFHAERIQFLLRLYKKLENKNC